MKRITLAIAVALGIAASIGAIAPSVGLYWVVAVDPTAGAGVSAPTNQLLFRTDSPSIYYKSGAAATSWTNLGFGVAGQQATFTGFYGAGIDGALDYDGVTAVLGVAPAAGVYTLTRDVTATTIQVDAGVVVQGPYRLIAQTSLENNGTIRRNGTTATSTTGGALAAAGFTVATTAGGNTGLTGAVSATTLQAPYATTSTATNAGTAGLPGGVGPVTFRGGGGGGGSASSGGEGGDLTVGVATSGNISIFSLLRGAAEMTTTRWTIGSGGGGGGGAGVGGGGGGGGGMLIVMARTISGIGAFEAKGGNGFAGGANGGGGGGGGGGAIVLLYNTRSGTTTTSVVGGTGGNAGSAGGAGGDGAAGRLFTLNMTGDGT